MLLISVLHWTLEEMLNCKILANLLFSSKPYYLAFQSESKIDSLGDRYVAAHKTNET